METRMAGTWAREALNYGARPLLAAGPSDPRDVAVLGERPPSEPTIPGGSAPPLPPPAPVLAQAEEPGRVLDPQPDRNWVEFLALQRLIGVRQENMPHLMALVQGLHRGELKDKAFQNAANSLIKAARFEEDPLISRIATLTVSRHFQWKEPLDEYQSKLGPLGGVERRLEQISGYTTGEYALPPEHIGKWFDELDEVTREIPAPMDTVRLVARMAHRFYRRAERTDLKEEVRQVETPEQDLKWADQLADLVGEWTGRADAREVLKKDVPPITDQGEMLPLRPGFTISWDDKSMSAFSRGLTWGAWERKEKPDPVIESCNRLVDESPARARKVAAKLARAAIEFRSQEGRGDYDVLLSIGVILQNCNPEVAELFRPYAAEMAGLTQRLIDQGELNWNSTADREGRVEMYRGLLQRFPELATQELVARQLTPLASGHHNATEEATGLILEQLDAHPEWMPAVMDHFLDQPSERREWYFPTEQWALMQGAAERGWRPSPLQLDRIASFVWVAPTPKDKESKLSQHVKHIAAAAKVLQTVERRHPGSTHALRLPDTAGRMVSVKEALVDRLLSEEKLEAGDWLKAPQSRSAEGLSTLLEVLFPDPRLTESMLSRAEAAYAKAGDMQKWAAADQLSLALVSSLELEPANEERLRQLASGYYEGRGNWFSPIVDKYRAEYAKQVDERLEKAATLDEKLEHADEALRLFLHRLSDYELERHSQTILKALKSEDPAALEWVGKRFITEFVAAAQDQADLGHAPRAAQRKLWLAFLLAADSEPLTLHMLDSLRPLAGVKVDYWSPVRKVMESQDRLRLKHACTRLKESMPHRERAHFVEFASTPGEEPPAEAISAWSQACAESSDWTKGLVKLFKDDYAAYIGYTQVVATGAPDDLMAAEWSSAREIYKRLGGSQDVSAAQRGIRDYFAFRQEGVEAVPALERVYLRYLGGDTQPAEEGPASGVLQTDEMVQVGGVRVRRRR